MEGRRRRKNGECGETFLCILLLIGSICFIAIQCLLVGEELYVV